ncbi:MAG: hypothetical protein DME21_08070 [Verrucomicrobia bacterium]|nr:MAG: hypothetical protein DME21_08070 [Verrucomicrobiota bacterium]
MGAGVLKLNFYQRRKLMKNYDLSFQYSRGGISRRNLIRGMGAAAGAVLGSGLWTPVRADRRHDENDENDDNESKCGVPLPIPHTTAGPFGPLHFYFPGPIDGSAVATDATGTHTEGRDPSTITNFEGFVGQADLGFSGTAIDTHTGAKAAYSFHTDTRFMKGEFIGSDQRRHKGAFAFI